MHRASFAVSWQWGSHRVAPSLIVHVEADTRLYSIIQLHPQLHLQLQLIHPLNAALESHPHPRMQRISYEALNDWLPP